MLYKIIPLLVGTFLSIEKSTFTYNEGCGEKIKAPIFSWLIKGENEVILVDTGPPSADQALRHPIMKQEKENALSWALKIHGISQKNIKWIVLTHLHWDHCYNLKLFPNAKFIIQKKELQYAITPLPIHQITYETNLKDVQPSWFDVFQRMFVINGDYELTSGLKILFVPGHTPGTQGLNVNTKKGKYLIASDTFPTFENFEKVIPPGIHVDLNEWYDSFYKVKNECDFILPGHDMKVLDKSIYGE